jgi:hypothetical protein
MKTLKLKPSFSVVLRLEKMIYGSGSDVSLGDYWWKVRFTIKRAWRVGLDDLYARGHLEV